LTHYFNNNPDPDFLTFSGSGEPTLNISIGDILQFVKQIRPHIPVAVLTNGTLLFDQTVRNALKEADVVLPSLDAATEDAFRKINRPPDSLKIDSYIQGLIDFRKEYKGKIWLEIFILPGYNDSVHELNELKNAVLKIAPDAVQLNTLDRPGTVPGLRGASRSEMQKIADEWKLDNVGIIAAAPEREKLQSFRKDVETAILETIVRRPCTLDDLSKILGLHISEINKYLDVLDGEGRIEAVSQERGVFYQVKEKNYR